METIVLHETPTNSLLPRKEAEEAIDLLFEIYAVYKNEGVKRAIRMFGERIIVGIDDRVPRLTTEIENQWNQCEYKMPWMGIYCPNLFQIRESQTSVVICPRLFLELW